MYLYGTKLLKKYLLVSYYVTNLNHFVRQYKYNCIIVILYDITKDYKIQY